MSRTNKVILIAGTRGTGKTDFIKKLVLQQQKILPKCLIVDTFDNPVWHDMKTWDNPEGVNLIVPTIPLSKFPSWNKGFGKMFSSNPKSLMDIIQKHAKNTFIVFEDASKYIKRVVSEDVNKFVLDSKQKNLDMVFIFHSLRRIPPDLIDVSDILILFKTQDGKLPSKYSAFPGLIKPMQEVEASKDRYFHKTILLN